MKSFLLTIAAFVFSAAVGFSQTTKTKSETKQAQPAKSEVKQKAPVKAPTVRPVTPTTESKQTPTRAQQNAKSQQQGTAAPAKEPVRTKKDGTPDRRYKENKKLKNDGTPDMRYKENQEKEKSKTEGSKK